MELTKAIPIVVLVCITRPFVGENEKPKSRVGDLGLGSLLGVFHHDLAKGVDCDERDDHDSDLPDNLLEVGGCDGSFLLETNIVLDGLSWLVLRVDNLQFKLTVLKH